jgi:hypothetical protein
VGVLAEYKLRHGVAGALDAEIQPGMGLEAI